MKLSFTTYRIFLKHPFGISRSSNNWYDIVLLFLQDGNIIGRGEAAPSIRYKESTEKILSVLNRGVNIPQSENMTLEKMQDFIYPQLGNIKSLQAAFSMALWDWWSQKQNVPVWKILGCENNKSMETSFTIAIGRIEEIERKINSKSRVSVYWSSDSKNFVMQGTDSRMIKDLWVINSVARKRPTLETYKYHMPGEQEYYKREILIFDTESKNIKKVELDSNKQQYISIFSKRRKPSQYRDDFRPTLLLSDKGKIYFNTISRDRKKLDVCVADINTGKVDVLIQDKTNTYFYETKPVYLLKNETEMIHWSENDGWGHFYRYNSNGKLINRITKGPFHSYNIKHVDEKTNTMYFSAHGVDKSLDPYFEHTYRVSLLGGTPKILNKGNFNTMTSPNDNHRYFVNNFSRVNTVPKSELRNSDGSLVMNLETADLSSLFDSGYQFPEPFKAKADDGITDIYGVIYKPFDFDENKKYPLLEYVYPGPQTESVNKSFSVRMDRLEIGRAHV